MLSRLFVFIFCGFCILSCSKEEVVIEKKFNDNFPFNCLEQIEIDSNTLNLAYPNELDTSKYCEVVFVDNPILLEKEHKFWMAHFCEPTNNAFTYVNEIGTEILLNISQKQVAYYSTEMAVTEDCIIDNKKTLYYFQQETARIDLLFSTSTPPENSTSTLIKEITIFLSNRIENNNGSFKIFPALQITYRRNNLYFTSMDLNLNQLEDTTSSDIQLIETFEIFNDVFRDVYTDTRYAENESIQIFYNQAYGIVAFTDTENVQWKLKT